MPGFLRGATGVGHRLAVHGRKLYARLRGRQQAYNGLHKFLRHMRLSQQRPPAVFCRDRVGRVRRDKQKRDTRSFQGMGDRKDPFVLHVHVEYGGIDDVVDDRRERCGNRGRGKDGLASCLGELDRQIRRQNDIVLDDQVRFSSGLSTGGVPAAFEEALENTSRRDSMSTIELLICTRTIDCLAR